MYIYVAVKTWLRGGMKGVTSVDDTWNDQGRQMVKPGPTSGQTKPDKWSNKAQTAVKQSLISGRNGPKGGQRKADPWSK